MVRTTVRDLGGLDTIVALCDTIIANEQRLMGEQRRWKAAQKQGEPVWSPEILLLDVVLDRQIAQLRDLLTALAAFPDDRGKAAGRLVAAHLGQGVAYYTQCVIEEEVARVGELLAAFSNDGADVAAATATDAVARIRATHTEYDRLVHATTRPALTTYDAVKQMDLVNHRAFLGLVTELLAYAEKATDPAAARKLVLLPVAEQDSDIGEAIRAKRALRDVDPESGETETDDSNEA